LSEIGGDCAGAVEFWPENQKSLETKPTLIGLNEDKLARLLIELERKPLLAGDGKIRLSLAGAQNKIAVFIYENNMYLANGIPTSHILKPAIKDIEDSVYNELFCLRLSSHYTSLYATVGQAQHIPYLLVQRYDRKVDNKGQVQRLHQEDFCQALAIPPEKKYENEGGPTLKQCFNLISQVSSQPAVDLLQLQRGVIFNYLIGNADAHGKNFSLLYPSQTEIKLAPFYDLICTAVYPEIHTKMAMKIGGRYQPEEVLLRHWYRLAADTVAAREQLKRELKQMATTLPTMASTAKRDLLSENAPSPIYDKIIEIIKTRCQRVLMMIETPV